MSEYRQGTVSWVIERFIEKMEKSTTKTLGPSQRYTLRVIQRMKIGGRDVEKLDKHDAIEMCEELIAEGLCPATVQQYVTYLVVALKYAKSAFRDCAKVNTTAFEDAKPFLAQNRIIGKPRPRDRRLIGGEWEQIIAYYKEQAGDPRTRIPMAEIVEFQVWSARRIGETCRIKCADVNREKRTVIVRDMKDPRQKKGNDVEVPLLGRAWEIVAARLANWDGHNPNTRVFQYNAKSCSASFTNAKKALGIKNLRLHDMRREAASRLFEAGFSVQEVMLVTGHKTPQMLLRVYTKLKPEDLHLGPAAKRAAPELRA
jgi:integrase